MKLEDIGFYTLSDNRVNNASSFSPLWRCELLITDKCNFKCPYCRDMRPDLKGTLTFSEMLNIVNVWKYHDLKNIRFSGGEPTLHKDLPRIITYANGIGIERIAISTNGSADLEYYKNLIDLGLNDISISLDACCSSFGEIMCGINDSGKTWSKVIKNIEELSKLTYVTVGMVFDENNVKEAIDSIIFANNLGVSDIRIISSAQYNEALENLNDLPQDILDNNPILKYRVNNFKQGRNVRGIKFKSTNKCFLALDDMATAKNYHFPCIIYLREMGDPIGILHKDTVRDERRSWVRDHNTHEDPICSTNCLDVCVDYNNKFYETMSEENEN